MSLVRWSAIFALALAPLAVIAQDKPMQADPADPAEIVPASQYESAFHNFRAFVDLKESPAKAWRAANDEMGRVGGHMGQIDETPASVNPDKPQPVSMPTEHDVHLKKEGK